MFTLTVGDVSHFFGGLDGMLGGAAFEWQDDPRGAMVREHCNSVDSHTFFTTSNMGITTNPQIEWHYVAAPDQRQILRLDAWPGTAVSGARDEHGMRDAAPKPPSGFKYAWADVNQRLRAIHESDFSEEMFIGDRKSVV